MAGASQTAAPHAFSGSGVPGIDHCRFSGLGRLEWRWPSGSAFLDVYTDGNLYCDPHGDRNCHSYAHAHTYAHPNFHTHPDLHANSNSHAHAHTHAHTYRHCHVHTHAHAQTPYTDLHAGAAYVNLHTGAATTTATAAYCNPGAAVILASAIF